MKKHFFSRTFLILIVIVFLIKVIGCALPTEDKVGKGTETKSGEGVKLIWNVWPERNGARYDPLPTLEKGKQYRIVLDLSAFGYGKPGVKHEPPDSRLEDIIREKLKTKNLFFNMVAFVMPDTTYFEEPSHADRSKKLTVELDKIRRYKGKSTEEMWFDIENKKEKSDYVFGHQSFTLSTREDCDDGWASVAIVLFSNMRPIDEVKANFCIGECKAERPESSSNTSELDVLSEKASAPDGSLYFLELKQNKLLGLFLENTPGKEKGYNYISWKLKTVESLNNQITKIFKEFNENYQKSDLERTGKTLMQNLFKDENKEAYKTFKSFVRKKIEETKDKKVSPSLFVRVVTSDQKISPFIPMGFLIITPDTQPADTNDQQSSASFFLGRYFRIISPLPFRQSYGGSENCIPHVVSFLPPENTGELAFKKAYVAMAKKPSDQISADYTSKLTDPSERIWQRNSIRDKKAIDKYLSDNEVSRIPTALLILSHQSEDRIWFENEKDYLSPGDIRMPFGRPSMAILNGCETAATDQNEFVERLNEKGVDAVIATSARIRGYMNGRFFYCFDEMLRKNRAAPLSQIFHDTQICLWNDKNTNNVSFDANALKYVFLGNGDLTLCIK